MNFDCSFARVILMYLTNVNVHSLKCACADILGVFLNKMVSVLKATLQTIISVEFI